MGALRMPATAIDRPVLRRTPQEAPPEAAPANDYELESEVPRFRRRRRPARHRRPRKVLALARMFLVAVAVVGAPVALGSWLVTSPQFELHRIAAEGTLRVPGSWLEEALAPLEGENLLLLSLPAVRSALAGHPWIEGVAIRKDLPDGLQVTVRERRPVAVAAAASSNDSSQVSSKDQWRYLDAAGRVIAPAEAAGGSIQGLLRLRGLPEGAANLDEAAARARAALAVAREVQALPAPWAESLEEIEVLGPQDFLLRSPDLDFPLLVRSGAVAAKLPYFQQVQRDLQASADRVAAVDLRFDRRIVVRTQSTNQSSRR